MQDEPRSEPTLAQVLAAVEALAAQAGRIDGKLDALNTAVGEMNERVEHVEAMLDQVGEDVVAVKVNQGFTDRHIADFQTWARRHQGNPNAHGTAA